MDRGAVGVRSGGFELPLTATTRTRRGHGVLHGTCSSWPPPGHAERAVIAGPRATALPSGAPTGTPPRPGSGAFPVRPPAMPPLIAVFADQRQPALHHQRTKDLLLSYPREEAGLLPGREKGARPEQMPVRRPSWTTQFAPLSADRRANGTGTRLRRPTNRATAGEVADQDDRRPTRVAPGARTSPDAARFMPVLVAAPVVAPVRSSAPTVWWSVRSRGSLMPSPE